MTINIDGLFKITCIVCIICIIFRQPVEQSGVGLETFLVRIIWDYGSRGVCVCGGGGGGGGGTLI